ncbi:MAG: type I 3-dehydroquinate dehydratase [Christensenellales bacterium]
MGADICKIAVMPRKRRDVVALTAACAQADDALTQPIIAISMGDGHAHANLRQAMGSCLSFGTAGAASARLGQMEAGALREALALVHRALAREAQEF